jgi:hypothetical protein
MDSSVLPKEEIWFCACAITFQTQSRKFHPLTLCRYLRFYSDHPLKRQCVFSKSVTLDPSTVRKCQNQVYQYMNLHCCEYSNLMYIKCKIIAKKIRFKLQTCFFLTVNAEIKAWTDPMLLPDLHVHDAFYKQCKIIMNRT